MFSMRVLILGAARDPGRSRSRARGVAAAQTAPACAPATLDNSALQDGAVTVSPLAGSRDASPQTQISFLGVPAGELSAISVVGSRSGAHSGRLAAYSQGDGASFLPSRPFAEGERVTVRARLRVGGSVRAAARRVRDRARRTRSATTPRTIAPGSAAEVQSFHSRPESAARRS